MSSRARIVYSTGSEGEPSDPTDPADAASSTRLLPGEHDLRVRIDRKGRRGRTVTRVGPFRLRRADVAEVLRDLKRRLGTGGGLAPDASFEGGAFVLELQGERVEEVLSRLAELGFRTSKG